MVAFMANSPISPLDGRYAERTAPIAEAMGDLALYRARLQVEARWLDTLCDMAQVPECPPMDTETNNRLRDLVEAFGPAQLHQVLAIEANTRHDVKAVEMYMRSHLAGTPWANFVHFACTSEDINSVAVAVLLSRAISEVWLPAADDLLDRLYDMADVYSAIPMLAHTHGQPASPTTLGKEIGVFAYRLERTIAEIRRHELAAKWSGATGTFGAHMVAYPEVDWRLVSRRFVKSFGLQWTPISTQIDSHDTMAQLFHMLIRANQVVMDLSTDMWLYISMGYLGQRRVDSEVGSSTMPHKINPIDFENAEANVGLSNAILGHLATKITVSRLQRDLSDSSAIRNVGTALGHSFLALQSTLGGLARVVPDTARLQQDLDTHWEVLTEAAQTIMRKHGHPDPYGYWKQQSRGVRMNQMEWMEALRQLDIPEADKAALADLTPATYIGLAAQFDV